MRMPLSLAVFSIFLFLLSQQAFAVPQLINFQGKLTDSAGTPVTGTRNIMFSLYDAPTGNAPLWTETQTVILANGIFSVNLGSSTAFPANLFYGDSLYLGVTVEGDTAEMTPRQQMTSAPYAQKAAMTETIPSTIVGDMSFIGSVSAASFAGDGSALTGVIATPGAHTHSGAEITSGTVGEARIDAAMARDSEIMPAVLAGDGSGSNLDSDTVDGQHAAAFAPASGSANYVSTAGGTITGKVNISGNVDVSGTVTAAFFSGDGSGLTNLSLTSVSGSDIIDGTVESVDIADGTIVNGDISSTAAISDVKLATIISAGKVSDSALSANVALLNSGQTFTGVKTFNPTFGSVPFAVDANKNGVVTNLNADRLDGIDSAGFAAAAHLHDAEYVNAAGDTMSGSLTVTGSVQASASLISPLLAPSSGDLGQSITLRAASGSNVSGGSVVITGGAASGNFAGGNIVLLPGAGSPGGNVGIGTASPSATLDVAGTVKATAFSGDGTGLTGITATAGPHTHSGLDIDSGTISDIRLSGNVTLLNAAQSITGVKAFNPSSGTVPFTVDATKSGVVTNLNADTLDGKHSADFISASANGSITVTASTAVGVGAIYGNQTGSGIGVRGFVSSSGHAVYGQSNGTGNGVYGTSASGNAIRGDSSNSLGNALYGYKNGIDGRAGYFQISNASNPSDAVYAVTDGPGNAVYGYITGGGKAGKFQINNSGSFSDALYASTNGTGTAGRFEISNTANSNSALSASTNGTGSAINATTSGSGNAIYAITTGTGNAGNFQGNVNITGKTTIGGDVIISNSHAPASPTDTGTTGQIAWDSNYIYICVAPNTWKRAALLSW